MVEFLLKQGADIRAQREGALAAAKAGLQDAVDMAGVPPPPDGVSAGWDEAANEARAREPYLKVIAVLQEAGAPG